MYVTQEAVTAEIAYRLERAEAAALGKQLRTARPSLLRRWLTRSTGVRAPAPRRRFTHVQDAMG